MNLSAVFTNVAHKRLAAVDLPNSISNQHELNGVAALKEFFGTSGETRGILQWHYFADDIEPTQDFGEFTFYDARAKSASRTGRSEWRFYYYGSFIEQARIGDWFFLIHTTSGKFFALIFEQDSGWLRAAQALFGVETSTPLFDAIRPDALSARGLQLLQRQIITELDLGIAIPAQSTDSEVMLNRFGRNFPRTKQMSEFARTQVEIDPHHVDETLMRWLDREEQLFRALEKVIIQERLDIGFENVDAFIEYSLSVQNRRKSRMGLALQNHLFEIFRQKNLRFTAQARTEGNNRPDFIFPGEIEYHNQDFDSALLVMLGVKSTSKERWRQVLDEADRISKKHLCTLESGISTKQTESMNSRELTLVIPSALHATYTSAQRTNILNIESFIDFVKSKQSVK